MRSLLLALDDTPAGASAVKLALSLAARHNAAVTGASVQMATRAHRAFDTATLVL